MTDQHVTVDTTPAVEKPAADSDWRDLADEIESAADAFDSAADDLTDLLDRFDWEDAPELVIEAAQDAGPAVYDAVADVDRRIRAFRAAVRAAVAGADEDSD